MPLHCSCDCPELRNVPSQSCWLVARSSPSPEGPGPLGVSHAGCSHWFLLLGGASAIPEISQVLLRVMDQ